MKMTLRKIIPVLLMLASGFSAFAYGFNDAVEDSGRQGTKKERTKKSSSSDDSDPCATAVLDVCCNLCASDVTSAWLALLALSRFRDYPYQGNTNDYIWYALSDSEDNSRMTRFSLSTSQFRMNKSIGWGNDTRFEGLFWFVGPYFEHMYFMNQDENDDSELYNGNIRLGGQVVVFQHNIFSLAVIAQWSHWYGDASPMLENGLSVGFQVQSFPVRPLHIDWRIEFQTFSDNLKLLDSVATLGILVNRYEIFAGWKYLGVENISTGTITESWNGVTFGAKVYF